MPTDNQILALNRRMKLLSVGSNAKTVKGDKKTVYLTAIMYLAPSTAAGYHKGKQINLCPMATEGCKKACLFTAGRAAVFENINEARIRKARWFVEDRETFMLQLIHDIAVFQAFCTKHDKVPAVRLNGTSDIQWEKIHAKGVNPTYNVMEMFPDVQFYDYTKIPTRSNLPENYSLTFSLAENNDSQARRAIKSGMNVAVVFRTPHYPATFMGLPVVNGDETDLRILDPKGCIVGLKAKGQARYDESGFVRENVAVAEGVA